MYPSAGAPEPGYSPGFKQRAAKDFWEGNSRKQQFIWLHFCCKMQRLAWNELRLFVSPKPRVRVGTAAAAAQLIRWEGTLLQRILLLLFHIFNLPAVLRLSRHSISESPEPWNEHTKKSFKNKFSQTTEHHPFYAGIYRSQGIPEAVGAEPKHLLKSVSSVWSFKPHNDRYWGWIIRCGLSQLIFKTSTTGWQSFIFLCLLGMDFRWAVGIWRQKR